MRNGGARAHQLVAAAVSLAESGGNDHARSPSADSGLWQINDIHLSTYGVTVAQLMNPDVNARVAISISGNGSNWAAWCTCWVDPGPNCGHGYLPAPQPGSPAGNRLLEIAGVGPAVTAVTGGVGGVIGVATQQPGVKSALSAWAYLQHDFGPGRAARLNRLHRAYHLAKGLR